MKKSTRKKRIDYRHTRSIVITLTGQDFPFYITMTTPRQTPRQQIKALLYDHSRSANELALLLGIPERHIEEHLSHIIQTIQRDRTRYFRIIPSTCRNCGFTFRDRKRLTRPSRCPKCRSESIIPPQYEITLNHKAHIPKLRNEMQISE